MIKEIDLKSKTIDNLVAIANQFNVRGQITDIQAFGNGNINDTFLVTLRNSTQKHVILQRINTHVFHQPELVMQNMRVFTDHATQRLQDWNSDRRWEIPSVILTQDNREYWVTPEGAFWRTIGFIEAAQSFDTVTDSDRAREAGCALGRFHNLVSDLPPEKLAVTLEGFHITPRYLQQFDAALAKYDKSKSPEIDFCLQFIQTHRNWVSVLEDAKISGELLLRLMHGDPKINNVLFDNNTERAVSVIDLDTLMPGLIHYDIGDCLRSSCNSLGEETQQWQEVRFETELAQAILQGYVSQAKDFLTEKDYEYIYDSIRLLAFELGLRFFTDYLVGNVHFSKVKYAEHNLVRALVQFQLTQSIETQQSVISAIVQDLRRDLK
ncbi:aminoglycoside phosphotransferase family protein [Chroococcidiopsis sp. FACHB-1243]|uniref:phosphotransferase enzyme family protein n=1 Tax=Chroococcidiopsis sp. [FACHB-1243] TaxID=2692781 RepID=UPI00177B86B1|nr:aminoglycoside phosphotransferase family protein [Chroococcidiopsis sp. [FACHB-1243]]MBD2308088.1 aminoglycoside phosphotransferase family protein [Chroococcidiopsis sp. [FACHB-1243]]